MTLQEACRVRSFISRCTRHSAAVNLIYPQGKYYSVYIYDEHAGYPGWGAVLSNLIHSVEEGINYVFAGRKNGDPEGKTYEEKV